MLVEIVDKRNKKWGVPMPNRTKLAIDPDSRNNPATDISTYH